MNALENAAAWDAIRAREEYEASQAALRREAVDYWATIRHEAEARRAKYHRDGWLAEAMAAAGR